MDFLNLIISPESYIGLTLAAVIANLFPGVPEEAFLLGLGIVAGASTANFITTSLFLIMGFLLIDSFVYYLARHGNKVLQTVVTKFIGNDFLEKKDFLKKHINKIIFGSRFILQLRIIGPCLAGFLKHPYQKFILVDLLALLIYVPMMLGIGYYFKDKIINITTGTSVVGNIIIIVAISIILLLLAKRAKKLFRLFLSEQTTKKIKTFFGFSKLKDSDK